ncbi:hypothetical protein GCM10010232_44730 [Streptomyces amakusaensis]
MRLPIRPRLSRVGGCRSTKGNPVPTPESMFLAHASEVAFDAGLDRFRVSSLTLGSRRLGLTEADGPPQPPVYRDGEPPVPGREGRRAYDWQPAADAPSWMNMAWLLEDLAVWVHQMADDRITVTGVEAPEPDWCDVLVLDGDSRYRARLRLAGRDEPLDFPGMYLRDLFAEGRWRDRLVPGRVGGVPVVDLRDTV